MDIPVISPWTLLRAISHIIRGRTRKKNELDLRILTFTHGVVHILDVYSKTGVYGFQVAGLLYRVDSESFCQA